MEDRESALVTVQPTNALGRLAARTKASRVVFVIVAVVALLIAVYIGAALLAGDTLTGVETVPSVPR